MLITTKTQETLFIMNYTEVSIATQDFMPNKGD